jgi:hypothetical protein
MHVHETCNRATCHIKFVAVQVLVVSEVDRVHPVLYPLLRRELQKQAGRLVSSYSSVWIQQSVLHQCTE